MRISLVSKKVIISVSVLFVVAALLLLLVQQEAQIKTGKPRTASSPNILFIILDAARADHFSYYGYKKDTTPCMDSIARKGAVFLNHFSNATNTPPAIPRIFFSRYFSIPVFHAGGWPWKIRQVEPEHIFKKFDDEQVLLTDILSRHGYRTALFHNHAQFTKDTYLVQKFDESFYFERSYERPADEDTISAVVSWLKKNKKQKFFIYCHIMSPHRPYPPKEEDAEFLEGENPSVIKNIREALAGNIVDAATNSWNQEELRILRGLYDGNLKYTDKWIGILYDGLKRLNLVNKTLIIITSDHGENLGEHGMLVHGGPPWDSVIHVPLIMVYPPLIPPGKKVNGLTESIDIMPTILDISKIDLPKGKTTDGISLLGAIQNPEAAKEAVFTNKSIRTAEYKYIPSKNLLYDLRKDPSEKRNIAQLKPLIRERLKDRFNKAMKPYKERYEESKRKEPPDFAFYYPMWSYKLSPGDVFQRYGREGPDSTVLEKTSPEKPWVLTLRDKQHHLFCLPAGSSPPPITLSAPLPNSTYRIYVLLESPDKIPLSPEKIGFKFRFDIQSPFVFPEHIESVTEYNGHFYSYLDLGEVKVKNKKISLQILFLSPDKKSYKIRHIKFVPARCRKEDAADTPSKEELHQRLEQLKSLGYL